MNFTITEETEQEKVMNRIGKIYKTSSTFAAPREVASGRE